MIYCLFEIYKIYYKVNNVIRSVNMLCILPAENKHIKGTLGKIAIFYGEVNGTTVSQEIVIYIQFEPLYW